MRFFVSEKGQKMFAEVNREYPAREGIAAHKDVPAAGSFKVADVPMEVLGKRRDETLDLIESVGMP
jgi:iron(III) transport system substrate-binding protein